MSGSPRPPRGPRPELSGDLYLGLVILPAPGRLAYALQALATLPALEIAEPEGHRVPAFAQVPSGLDEALLAQIIGLPDVLGVDVAFAQLVSEDTP